MADTGKISDKAAELAGQAKAAAGPIAAQAKEKATQLAGQAKAAAGPIAAQAKDKASEFAGKAAPVAQHGVETTAGYLDKATGRKYSDKISAFTTKLGEHLDPKHGQQDADAPAAPEQAATEQTVTEQAVEPAPDQATGEAGGTAASKPADPTPEPPTT